MDNKKAVAHSSPTLLSLSPTGYTGSNYIYLKLLNNCLDEGVHFSLCFMLLLGGFVGLSLASMYHVTPVVEDSDVTIADVDSLPGGFGTEQIELQGSEESTASLAGPQTKVVTKRVDCG